jgi:RHS repeat-associated protein
MTSTSLYDGGRVILETQGGTFTGTYTYGVSLIRRNGEFFQYDGLGSARTFTNASGVNTTAGIYERYGNTVKAFGSTGSPYQFGATSGYRNDEDAGIMQVGARYYDPATGSFLTRDTDLSQLAYVYCGDDPINLLDPNGHWPHWMNIARYWITEHWDYIEGESDQTSLLIDKWGGGELEGLGGVFGSIFVGIGAVFDIRHYGYGSLHHFQKQQQVKYSLGRYEYESEDGRISGDLAVIPN